MAANTSVNSTPERGWRKQKKKVPIIRDGCVYHPDTDEKLTNWAPEVMSILEVDGVTTGAVFRHYPAGTLEAKRAKFTSFLHVNDMSSQESIKSALNEKEALFTSPANMNTQMLPLLFLNILDEYKNNPEKKIIHAVKRSGLQRENLWCYVDNQGCPRYFIRKENDVEECTEEEAGLVFVPAYTQHDKLSIPATLENPREALNSLLDYSLTFGSNRSSFLMTFGCVVVALHFQSISSVYPMGIPILVGPPSAGKTSCLDILLSCVGRRGNIFRNSVNGICEMMRSSCSPIHWGDVEQFSIIEEISFFAYNKSQRAVGKEVELIPNTIPICTSNGYFFSKGTGSRTQKQQSLKRLLARLMLIPFQPIVVDELRTSNLFLFAEKMKAVVDMASHLFPFVLYLEKFFMPEVMREDGDMTLVMDAIDKNGELLDSKSKLFYSVNGYAACKILREGSWSTDQIKEFINDFFLEKLPKTLKEILKNYSDEEIAFMVEKYLQKAHDNPKTRAWMKVADARGCGCSSSVYLACSRIQELEPSLVSETIYKAISEAVVPGCNNKPARYGGQLVKVTSHIRLSSLSVDLRKLEFFGGMKDDEKIEGEQGEMEKEVENEGMDTETEADSSDGRKKRKDPLHDHLSDNFKPLDEKRRKKNGIKTT